ncbi:MAG: IS1182 family transposase [Candidatus Omnitrophota bacterium]|nr:IS1182 family transposase [Candidatus Omnitrophota bacterium]
MNYREYNPNQTQLFGYKPEDVLSEDHLAYLIDEMVEQLDLKKFYDLTPGAGNPAYDPRLMLKVLFFGYAIGVFSSRKLQQQCQENLAFIHLSRGQQPKFRAICEFRSHQQGHIKELFSQLLEIAKKLKILKIGRLVLDSTKIKANASSGRTVKADAYDEVLKSIDDYLTNAQAQDSEEDTVYGKELTGQELPKELRSKSKRLQRLKEIITDAKSKKLNYVNTTDPEAKFMKDSGINKIKPSYSAQAVLDKDSGLIVACATCDTSADNERLEPMVREAEENTGIKPSAVDADSGYYSNASIAVLEKEHIDTCIPDSITASSLRKANVATNIRLAVKYTQDDFRYDAQQNSYICPQSKTLTFRREYEAASNKNAIKIVKEYVCKERCSSCPDAIRCLTHGKVKHRTLTIDPNHKTLLLTQEKFKQEEYRQRYKKRGSFIERVFGHFKKNLKFTQFHLRGKANADVETTLLCIGFNLLVFKHWL